LSPQSTLAGDVGAVVVASTQQLPSPAPAPPALPAPPPAQMLLLLDAHVATDRPLLVPPMSLSAPG
jgi:hypothetical protein